MVVIQEINFSMFIRMFLKYSNKILAFLYAWTRVVYLEYWHTVDDS